MKYAGCWHDGHTGHIDVKGFEVNGIAVSRSQTKRLESKEVAGSSEDTFPICGYVYSGRSSQGKPYDVIAWKTTIAHVNSYDITEECLCTFRVGKSGAEAPTVLLKGPIKGDLEGEAFWVLCERGFGPPLSIKRDLAVSVREASPISSIAKRSEVKDLSVTTPATPSVQAKEDAILCGEAYTEHGQRGDSVLLYLEELATITGKTISSYKIAERCRCNFRTVGLPVPSIAVRTGPATGDLGAAYGEVLCTHALPPKRDEPRNVAVTTPAPASENTFYCGHAYTERNSRGTVRVLEADKTYFAPLPRQFMSYFVSGNCSCNFGSQSITGPGQGDLRNAADDVKFSFTGSRKREESQAVAATEGLAATSAASRSPKPPYCGYAYLEKPPRQTGLPPGRQDHGVLQLLQELHHLRELHLHIQFQGRQGRHQPCRYPRPKAGRARRRRGDRTVHDYVCRRIRGVHAREARYPRRSQCS
ncbi:hypothetical protein PMIN04_007002 [Paraphaeosphaeria minitans]